MNRTPNLRLMTVISVVWCGVAQSQKSGPVFTVASVKSADLTHYAGASLSPEINGGSFRCLCSVQSLVIWAYKLRRDEIVFPHGLKDADLYQVSATFPESSRSDLPAMLRRLLDERFR